MKGVNDHDILSYVEVFTFREMILSQHITFIFPSNLHRIGIMPKKIHIEIDRELCTGCGICIRFCPKDVLGESETLNQYGNFYADVKKLEECILCRRCELYCPDFAISVEVEE